MVSDVPVKIGGPAVTVGLGGNGGANCKGGIGGPAVTVGLGGNGAGVAGTIGAADEILGGGGTVLAPAGCALVAAGVGDGGLTATGTALTFQPI